MNLFAWSIPFLCEKVTEMFYHVMNSKQMASASSGGAPEDPTKSAIGPSPKSNNFRRFMRQMLNKTKLLESEILRNKVKSISRMVRMFKTLRKDNEDILKLKGFCPDNKLPKGVLLEGTGAIKDAIDQFASAKKYDIGNEKRPDYP